MKIQVIVTRSHGLEVFNVLLNGTLVSVWLSQEFAITAANRLAAKITIK
jgi:hypothetical protein